MVDLDYRLHTDYRWGGQDLRKTLVRWASSVNNIKGNQQIISEDESGSTAQCYAFQVNDPSLIPHVAEVQKIMRYQDLRCRVLLCQNGTKLNVIPGTASRAQALREHFEENGLEKDPTRSSQDISLTGLIINKALLKKGAMYSKSQCSC